ncbi:hypothetical protein BS47DRAFT_151251 [Hydnum rufescens UP504]|uniref:Uncharacterized protein n=1 Tax=Hydnum rufescens UP504 TaxID=1448309 RepID=A0A9P6AP32_9AGAM|nr:hypothetical protein BS47DRAFT_151251 [Hydnum rufescens UP504]
MYVQVWSLQMGCLSALYFHLLALIVRCVAVQFTLTHQAAYWYSHSVVYLLCATASSTSSIRKGQADSSLKNGTRILRPFPRSSEVTG